MKSDTVASMNKNEIDLLKASEPPSAFPLAHVWEDLVNDFLEMACFLTEEERARLLGELLADGTKADAIHVHPGFSIDGRLVIVCEGADDLREFWIYEPREKKIRKQKIEI